MKAIIFFLVLLIVVSGCINANNEAQLRLACLNFSSPSASLIPVCDSQNSCLKKLNEKFFSENTEMLSFSSQKQLNEFKYDASLAWYYQNLALKNLQEINNACSQKNYAILPEKVNEFQNNSINGFGNLDNANEKAVSVLISLRGELEKAGINSIKEEELFNDYIKINNNLVQLSSPNEQLTKDSFAEIMLEQSKKLNQLTAQLESKDFVSEITGLEAVDLIDQDILRLWKDKSFYVPLTKKIATGFVSFFSKDESLLNSVNALNGIQINQILSVFNELNFGSMKKFSELLQQTSLHKKELIEENQKLTNSIKENLLISSQKTDALNGFFSNTNLQNLGFALDLNQTTISAKSFELAGINSIAGNAKNKLQELRNNFSILEEKKALDQVSLGKESQELKQLNNDLLQFISELDELNGLELESVSLCEAKISQIVKENKNNSSELTALIDAKIDFFKKEKELNQKLLLCSQIVELAQKNEKETIASEIFSLGSNGKCFQEIEKLAGLEELSQFKQRIVFLKNQLIQSPNSSIALDECNELERQLLEELNNGQKIIELNDSWKQASDLFEKLQRVNLLAPSASDMQFFAKKSVEFKELGKNFEENFFNPLQGAKPEELLQKLSLFRQEAEENITKSLKNYFEQNFSKSFAVTQIPEINAGFDLVERISFNNIFFYWEKPFFVSMDFDNSAVFSNASQNISGARIAEKKAIIDFSSLPEGESFAEFNETQIIEAVSKKQIISDNNGIQLVQEKIGINSNVVLPKALYKKIFEQTPSEINVLVNGISVDFLLQGNELQFFIPIKENETIELLYKIQKNSAFVLPETKLAKLLAQSESLNSVLEQRFEDLDYLKQNFPSLSKNFEAKILQAKQLLSEADKFLFLNQVDLAQNRLIQAKKLLLYSKETALFEAIEEQRKLIEKNTKKIIQQTKNPSNEFSGFVQLFDQTNKALINSISANDLNKSLALFEDLNNASQQIFGQLFEETKTLVLSTNSQIEELKSSFSDENFSSVLALADSSIVESQPLIYSKQEILGLKNDIAKINGFLSGKEIVEFQRLVLEEKFEEALLASKSFSSGLKSALIKGSAIKQTLETIQKNLQGNSQIVLEKLRQRVLQNPSKENVEALIKAENALKENDYESFSQMAGFILLQNNQSLSQLPLMLLLPLIVGIIALIGVKALGKSKHQTQKNPLRILKPRN